MNYPFWDVPHIGSGWVIGLISLWLFLKYEKHFLDWWNKLTLNAQILWGFSFSAGIILLGMLVLWAISGVVDPPEWANYASEARDFSHYCTLGGFMFGAVVGVSLMQKYARFSVDGSLLIRVIRYVAGMIVLFAIYLGLDYLFALFTPDVSITGYILRYIRYASIGIWAGFGAPWTFIKIGLAHKNTKKRKH